MATIAIRRHPLATMSGANGCCVGANGDSVTSIGDNEWRQWMLHWRKWRFGDIHWRQWQSPLAPLKWRHLIHSMAINSSQSPFRLRLTTYDRHRFARAAPAPRAKRNDSKNRGRVRHVTRQPFRVSGSFGDPMAPIHN